MMPATTLLARPQSATSAVPRSFLSLIASATLRIPVVVDIGGGGGGRCGGQGSHNNNEKKGRHAFQRFSSFYSYNATITRTPIYTTQVQVTL